MKRYPFVIAEGVLGSPAIAHVVAPRSRHTVCGRRTKASWLETRCGVDALPAGTRLCVSCERMKDASTMHGGRS